MAVEKLKPGDGQPRVVNPQAFQSGIKDIVRHKGEAKDWNGKAGQRTEQLADQTGMSARAITQVARLHRMEPAKRTTELTDFITGCRLMGFLDEDSLFGTPTEQAKEEVAKVQEKPTEPAAKASPGATGTDIQNALNVEDDLAKQREKKRKEADAQRAADAKVFDKPKAAEPKKAAAAPAKKAAAAAPPPPEGFGGPVH